MPQTLAVFISGTGTNLRTIAEFCKSRPSLARIGTVISNKNNVGGLEIAKEFGIPAVIIKTAGRNMTEFEREAESHLQGVDLICLAGFMRVLTPDFINRRKGKIINIHPSLLPSFKGIDAINDALKYGVKITGCTVHFVEPEVDSGEIISQIPVAVLPDDDFSSLKKRIQEAEKICYSQALENILQKTFR